VLWLQAYQESQVVVADVGFKQVISLSAADILKDTAYKRAVLRSSQERVKIVCLEAEIVMELIGSF